MDIAWSPEIEKKYRLEGENGAASVTEKARSLGMVEESLTLQKDWVPDFGDSAMKKAGVLLRIRILDYISGSGPLWLITLKVKRKEDGTHNNLELEASSEDGENVDAILNFMKDTFDVELNLDRLVSEGMKYASEVGLTKHRMYIEKRRRQYHDRNSEITLAIDELPSPAGWFAEIELGSADAFSKWEASLGLKDVHIETRDYGDIVKQVTLDSFGEERRELSFN